MKKKFKEKLQKNVEQNQEFAALLEEVIVSQETEAEYVAFMSGINYQKLDPEDKKLLICNGEI